MSNFSILEWLALALLIIGGINSGLYGIFHFDLIYLVFGRLGEFWPRIIEILVGLGAAYMIYSIVLYYRQSKTTPQA